MPNLSRLNLPADFQDITSQRMLRTLMQDRFWAKLFKLAGVKFSLEDAGDSEFSHAPGRGPSSNGADVAKLSEFQLMINDTSGQAGVVLVSDELKEGTGHTVRFNRQRFGGGG
jgi:hypothetical protein